MTDELMIQPQQDSAGSYAGIGAGIGALAGAGAGFFSPRGVTMPRYKSYEDILKESEDTFKKEIEKGGDNKAFWETAKEHAEKVKNAEAEYERKVSEIKSSHGTAAGQLPEDNQAAKDLKKAQEVYDKAVKAKTAGKTETVKAGAGKILPYDPNWAMTEAQRQDYQDLYNKYTTAESSFQTKSAGLAGDIASRKTKLKEVYDKISSDAGKIIVPGSAKRNVPKNMEDYLKSDRCTRVIEGILANGGIVQLTDKELVDLAGGKGAIETTKPSCKQNHEVFSVEYNGKNGFVQIQTKKQLGRTKYEKMYGKRVDETVNRIIENFKKYHEAQTELDALPEKIKFENGLVRKAGLKRGVSGIIKDAEAKLNEFAAAFKAGTYTKEMSVIEKAGLRDFVPRSGVTVTDSQVIDLMNRYSVDSPKELYALLTARQGIGRRYAGERDRLIGIVEGAIYDDPVLRKLEGKLEHMRSSDKDLNKIGRLIRGKYGNFLGGAGKTETKEIAGMTEAEAMEALKDSEAAKKLEAAKEAAKKEAEKLGLTAKEPTEEELAKIIKEKGLPASAKEYAESARTAAKDALEKDLGKIKTPNKWVNAAIAAAVLGLAGLGIGSAVKKDAA